MSKNYSVIDLFAGAGGFSLGFNLSGYNNLMSLEVDKWASETLEQNFNHLIINQSILEYQTNSKIFSVIPEKPDVIIGGPPCQGFSHAGRRKQGDPRNQMYRHFHNWVKVIRPQLFVIENVRGILNFKNGYGGKVLDDILEIFSSSGYQVDIWQLDSKDYGVPQSRKRIFLVGNLNGVHIPPPTPTHSSDTALGLSSYLTVGDAILDLPSIKAKEGKEVSEYDIKPMNQYQIDSRKNSSKVFNHVSMNHTDRMVARYQHIIDGNSLDTLEDDLKVRKRNGQGELSKVKFSLNYRYLSANFPSYTIPAHFYSSFIHPKIPRNITTREAARIQSFPDWYRFMGKRTMISSKLLKQLGKDKELNHLSQYNQVGNAVPPKLASIIANHIKEFIV